MTATLKENDNCDQKCTFNPKFIFFYFYSRQYENIDNISEAIHFFSKAQAYSNAIRICKEQGYTEQLWNMAVLAGPNEKLDAAKFFENADKPQFDKVSVFLIDMS